MGCHGTRTLDVVGGKELIVDSGTEMDIQYASWIQLIIDGLDFCVFNSFSAQVEHVIV